MRRVLHQRVLEGIDCVGWRAALKYKLGSDNPAESNLQIVLGKAGDHAQQFVRKLAADSGADLRHMPRRGQAIKPCQQRGVQTRRDRELRQCGVREIPVVSV